MELHILVCIERRKHIVSFREPNTILVEGPKMNRFPPQNDILCYNIDQLMASEYSNMVFGNSLILPARAIATSTSVLSSCMMFFTPSSPLWASPHKAGRPKNVLPINNLRWSDDLLKL